MRNLLRVDPPPREPAFAVLWNDGRRAVVFDRSPSAERIEAQLAALGLAHEPGAVILTLDRVIHPRELLLLGEAHPAVRRRILAARSG